MAIFKEKTKLAFSAYFWDGTQAGFLKLPAEVLDWCALLRGNLIYSSQVTLKIDYINVPAWLVFDQALGIVEIKDSAKIDGEFDEIDETGNVKPKPDKP